MVNGRLLVHQGLLGLLAPAGFAFEFGEVDDEVGLALELGEVPQAVVLLGLTLELGHVDLDLCFALEISAIDYLRRCGQTDQRQNKQEDDLLHGLCSFPDSIPKTVPDAGLAKMCLKAYLKKHPDTTP